MFLSLLLFGLFVWIWSIPSGPQCPKCDSYATAHFTGIHKETKEQVELKVCGKCKHIWDKKGNWKQSPPAFLEDKDE